MEAAAARTAFEENKMTLYAAVPSRPAAEAPSLFAADLTTACALIVGNEGRGVSREWLGVAQGVSIPTVAVESLNAAMAAGVLLYEAYRQRSARG